MFPDPHDVVPCGAKFPALPVVSAPIPLDFFPPERRPVRWPVPLTDGTCVPEAPIYEYGQSNLGKEEVGFSEDSLWVFLPTLDARRKQGGLDSAFC